MSQLIRRFVRDRSGSILTLAVFCLVLLLSFVALTLEYGLNLSYKQRLQTAADAASLAAAQAASTFVQSSSLSGNALIDAAIQAGQTQGLNIFNANSPSLQSNQGNIKSAVALTYNRRNFSATVTYSMSRVNAFGSLFLAYPPFTHTYHGWLVAGVER